MNDNQQSALIKADGNRIFIEPENGKNFTLEELYKLIDAETIQVVQAHNKKLVIIVDEDGKNKKKPFNIEATAIASLSYYDFIVGDAVVCPKTLFR